MGKHYSDQKSLKVIVSGKDMDQFYKQTGLYKLGSLFSGWLETKLFINMYYYFFMLSKVFQSFGTKSPMKSAMLVISAIQGLFIILVVEFINTLSGVVVNAFVPLSLILFNLIFNYYFFKKKKWMIMRRYQTEQVSGLHVFITLVSYVLGAVGVMYLLVPFFRLFS